MPRICNKEGCVNVAKWICVDIHPNVYVCNNDILDFHGKHLIKIVNNPCKICISEKIDRVKEATYGPLINGKLKRIYCKQHAPTNHLIKRKFVSRRVCQYPGCFTSPSFTNGIDLKRRYCKLHVPKKLNSCDTYNNNEK